MRDQKRKRISSLCSLPLIAVLLFLFSPQLASAHSLSLSPVSPDLNQLAAKGMQQCVQPPANINLNTLSDQQLVTYGFPTHSTIAQNAPEWQQKIMHAKHRYCGPAKAANVTNSTVQDLNWGGNIAHDSRGVWRGAEVNFTLPRLAPDPRFLKASYWAGVGGDTDYAGSSIGLVQAGVDSMMNNNSQEDFVWWEVYPSVAEQDVSIGVVYPGDSFYVYVASNLNGSKNNYFYISDLTTGNYYTLTDTSHPLSDSATAECVVERPELGFPNGAYALLANFRSVNYTNCDVYDEYNGTWSGIGNVTHDYDIMYANNHALTNTGHITNGGNFTTNWLASS